MKNKFLILLLLLSGGLASCSKEREAVPEKIPTVSGIKVETVTRSPLESYYEAVATVRSRTTTALSSKATGNITAVHVREGDRVKPGQLLIEIDNQEAAAQLKKAQAGVREAEEMLRETEQTSRAFESALKAAEAEQALAASTYARYQALLERKSVSPQEFDEVQARYIAKTAEVQRAKDTLYSIQAKREQVIARIDQARAEVTQARLSGEHSRIYAPLSGIVTAKNAEVGALASPGAPLLTVEDDTHYRLEAHVEEGMIGRVRLGEPVRVMISALGDQEWPARVAEIQSASDPASRSFIVKIDLPEDAGKKGPVRVLRSGLFGRVRFQTSPKEGLTIPRKAILNRGQLSQVFVVDPKGMAYSRLVRTGKTYGDRVEILSGLEGGERIIVEGLEKVQDGNRIEERKN